MTDVDLTILDFERHWWRHAGSMETEILERWGLSPAEYREQLRAIAARADALAYDPLTVTRLRRRFGLRRGPATRPSTSRAGSEEVAQLIGHGGGIA
jgi:hypothetical protein